MASREAGSRERAFCLSFAMRTTATKSLPASARGRLDQQAGAPNKSAAQLDGHDWRDTAR